MTLNPVASYPSARSYVLKLHRDADLEKGQIVGRIENMASGDCFEFNSGEQLLACLTRAAALTGDESRIDTGIS